MTEVKLEVTTNSMDTMVDVGDFVMVDDHLCMIARVGYKNIVLLVLSNAIIYLMMIR